mmetsp:Transcript_8455/g.24854  ORF Transcript_8455/g.24854 Transcript_8455/m.24854 type:complete len:1474 (-) Transcript_8455:307-4728(-)
MVEVSYDEAPAGIDVSAYRTSLRIYVNGEKVHVPEPDPHELLLDFLRKRGFTGAKLGCGEGGCGACTVVVSRWDAASGSVRHASVNACLMPLLAADGCAVTTVEGIGNARTGMHPVQQRMTDLHGSQCGFCTPGIVMAMYGIFLNEPEATTAHVEENMDGNLCRCTGYRPIWDAAKSLCVDAERDASDVPDKCATCPHKGEEGHACAGGADIEACAEHSVVSTSKSKLAEPAVATPYAQTEAAQRDCERKLPDELNGPQGPLRIQAPHAAWWKPASLADALAIKASVPGVRVVVGNTEVGIEARFKQAAPRTVLCTADIAELREVTVSEGGCVFGASAPLSAVEAACHAGASVHPVAKAAASMLRWFASNQIRNTACLGGNLATASPISDMNPLLAAAGAELDVASAARGTRSVPVAAFFKGYRKVDLAEDELIVRVRVPAAAPAGSGSVVHVEVVEPYKQARRREDDISIVTATFRASFAPSADGSAWRVKDAALAFGGLAPTTILAPKAAAALVGQEWSHDTFAAAADALRAEVRVPPGAPGGQSEFRTALAASFLFKFYIKCCQDLAARVAEAGPGASLPAAPAVDSPARSASCSFVTEPKPSTAGLQTYALRTKIAPGLDADVFPESSAAAVKSSAAPNGAAYSANYSANGGSGTAVTGSHGKGGSGKPTPHAAGHLHTTGEAVYVDDMPPPPGMLHAWLVQSTRAAARITRVDAAAARAMPGVKGVFFREDLPGDNVMGPVAHDEECFADGIVRCVGQVIGIAVGATLAEAKAAALAVKVEYEDFDEWGPDSANPIVTIEEAIAASSFYEATDHTLESGRSVEAALAEPGLKVVKGEFKLGGQEHFYLEANTTLAIPVEGGGMAVHTSTQAVTKTQKFVASTCGLPANKVVCHMKRMGGGFGGKETRSVFASAAAAVAALLTNQPVRLSLERDIDMQISGQRHAFIARYTAAATVPTDGSPPRLAALDAELFSNGGCALDLSGPVMDRALFHLDNCYQWPSLRCRGRVCRTHQAPHTAFRGFGGPQGMMVAEAIMEHLCSEVGADPVSFRGANLYSEGDETHFGQRLEAWNVPRAWRELVASSEIADRRAAAEAFNKEHRYRKRGLAIIPTKFGINYTAKFMNQGGALVHLYTDGTLLVTHGGTEMGQGLHTKVCQVVASSFDVPQASVHVAETASDKVANTIPTAASMSADLYGMAALDACEQIIKRLTPIRKALPEGATLAEVATAAHMQRVDLSAHGFYKVPDDRCGFDWLLKPPPKASGEGPDNSLRGLPFNYFTQGVGVAEVELDVLTGDHSVLRADLVVDVGSSLNPALDVGQIEGAFAQGMGLCTIEEVVWADTDHAWVQPRGRLFTKGPGAYKIPSFNDVPRDFRVHLLQGVKNRFAVHSSKAVGEPPLYLGFSVYMALREAVRAARAEHLGEAAGKHFIMHSPATSERLRMACADEIARACVEANNRADATNYVAKASF